MLLFLPWSPFKKLDRFWRLIGGGEGDPEGKRERTSGPTSCLQNAYRDWHRDATQKDNPCRRSGSKARSCREKALSLIKSSKHKGGYIYIYMVAPSQNLPFQCFLMLGQCRRRRGMATISVNDFRIFRTSQSAIQLTVN